MLLTFSILCFLMSIILLLSIINFLRRIKNNRQFQSTTARLQSKKVDLKKRSSGGGHSNYRLYVEYTYEVGGIKYTGNTYHQCEWWGGEVAGMERHVNEECNKLPETLTVWYNPQKPEEVCVKQLGKGFLRTMLVFFILMETTGIILLVTHFLRQ